MLDNIAIYCIFVVDSIALKWMFNLMYDVQFSLFQPFKRKHY